MHVYLENPWNLHEKISDSFSDFQFLDACEHIKIFLLQLHLTFNGVQISNVKFFLFFFIIIVIFFLQQFFLP